MSKLLSLGKELYRALNEGDAVALQRLLSTDFKGHLSAGLPHGLGRDYDSRDAMMSEAWAYVDANFAIEISVEHFFDAGDVLIVHGSYVGSSRLTGGALRADFAHFWVFDGRQFTGLRQVTDTALWHKSLKYSETGEQSGAMEFLC